MIQITIPASCISDYADFAALASESLRTHCLGLVKEKCIERVRKADEERQSKGRAYFDLEAKLAPKNWDELTFEEKEADNTQRNKKLEASKEGKAFEKAEQVFFKRCEELAYLDRDEHLLNTENDKWEMDLYESLLFEKVDQILGQNLFFTNQELPRKSQNDKRRAAIIFTDLAISNFIRELLDRDKPEIFPHIVILQNNWVSVIEITIENIDEYVAISTLAIESSQMSTRNKVKSIQNALSDNERDLKDYISLFTSKEGFGLNYAPESIAESISRSKFLKPREVKWPPRNERRVC